MVPTHRGAHRLPALLASLACQDFHGPWELVVVIDGHDPAVELALANYQAAPLHVLVNPTALGVAAALTRGFDAGQGTYLIRCDDDLTVPANFISGHLAAQAGEVNRLVVSLTEDDFEDTPYALAYGRAANLRAMTASYARPASERWINVAACFSLHRQAWAQSGGFDPRFAYGEDSEFGYRLWRSGCEIIIDPNLQVQHRGPSVAAETRVPRAFVSGASKRLFRQVHPETVRPDRAAPSWKARAWNLATSGVASTVRSPAGFKRLGIAADRALPHLPASSGGRLIALLVEAAGKSGLAHGRPDLHSYRGQKDAELRREARGRRAS